MKLKPHSTGLVLGGFMAVVHALWSVVVAFGLAKPYLDFIYSIHFLNNPYKIAAFNLTTAVILVAVTAVIGYLMGFVFALLWNKFKK